MTRISIARHGQLGVAILLLTLLSGCGAMTSNIPSPSIYSLDSTRIEATAATPKSRRWRDGTSAPTLIVSRTQAVAGFDSPRMVYVRAPHQREYFAHSEWVDTPARMLEPLLVKTIEESGAFGAVIPTPTAATGDLRLDTEIVRLQQDFGSQPSQVRFTLRASLVDNSTRQVLAQREFDTSVVAAANDPRRGVLAANRAIQDALESLAVFCDEIAGRWRPVTHDVPAWAGGGKDAGR